MSAQFTSCFARDLREFIAFKRDRGCIYGRRVEGRLLNFDRFAARRSSVRKPRLKALVTQWLSHTDGRKRETIRCDLSTVRQFCLFLRRRDPNCFVPDLGLAPTWKQIPRFRPYIYAVDEIRILLVAAKTLRPAYRAATFKTMIAVLYCTGIRPGEATRLRLCDLALQEKTLLVRKSKEKTRRIPFHSQLARLFRSYLAERSKVVPAGSKSPLFTQPNGRGYAVNTISIVFCGLLRQVGLKPPVGEKGGPRLYDLRHSYATHNLLRWYRDRVDLQSRLPLLSAYMGHDHILGTQVYLTATAELLHMASEQFEERFKRNELRS